MRTFPIHVAHPATSFEAIRAIASKAAPVALTSKGVVDAIAEGLVTHSAISCSYTLTEKGRSILLATMDLVLA